VNGFLNQIGYNDNNTPISYRNNVFIYDENDGFFKNITDANTIKI
jgi:hypothetical protein